MEKQFGNLIIVIFPCLTDNYGFLVHDLESRETATIDTPDPDEIERQLTARSWDLTYIFNTHHHWDHAGGNLQLKKKYQCEIYASKIDQHRIPGIDLTLIEGDTVSIGNHLAKVFETPGHTLGHIVYYFEQENVLFTGDTLFSMGCGRLFEGTPQQMWDSLQKLMKLPNETLIYCAHEYTLNNLKFALSIDPDNQELQKYTEKIRALRDAEQPSIPTFLSIEGKLNPFLKPNEYKFNKQNEINNDDLSSFRELRLLKDKF